MRTTEHARRAEYRRLREPRAVSALVAGMRQGEVAVGRSRTQHDRTASEAAGRRGVCHWTGEHQPRRAGAAAIVYDRPSAPVRLAAAVARACARCRTTLDTR